MMNDEIQQKSWFGRNWLWVVPVGGCLTIILLFIFGISAVIFGVSKAFKNSEPYEHAMDKAQNDSDVVRLLGKPIEANGVMSGNISLSNDDGEANFVIPIKGERGKGSLTVIAEKTDGNWTYEDMYVIVKETNDTIKLQNKNLKDF